MGPASDEGHHPARVSYSNGPGGRIWQLIVVGWLAAMIGYLVIAFFLIFPIKLHRRQKAEPAVS
jgi:hypothetical protein